jgi:uncharacterized protein (TIGR02145 family)
VNTFGHFADKPEDFGMFYQWNRTKAWPSTGETVTGWDSSIPSGSEWETTNDPCPTGWQVPTMSQFQGLVASGSIWGPYNGVAGGTFGSGTSTIFIPAAGELLGDEFLGGRLIVAGIQANYWTKEQTGGDGAYCLSFDAINISTIPTIDIKFYGKSIRCVKK